MTTYKIVRMYLNGNKRTIKRGLTLEEARAWCHDPETNSRTATGIKAMKRAAERGPWFDAYSEDK